MSLSNPRSNQSPVQKYFSIKSSTGTVTWYDKAAGKEVEVASPFKFIVLDTLNFIGGFHEPSNSGIYSNEVRNTRQESLTVRSKKGVLATGLYDVIKDDVKADGGKFGNSVYIAYRDEDGVQQLGNMKLTGAALSKWFDFRQGRNLDANPGVSLSGWTQEKKGRNEYFAPVFEGLSVSEESHAEAAKLDQELQGYLANAQNRDEQREYAEPEPSFTAPAQQQGFGGFGGGSNFDEAPPF